MATAEPPAAAAKDTPRRWAWPALALILAGGLVLRLWGVREGLPFVYNIDEADHFVPRAVEMFTKHTLNPHYFANPPAFTYLLHAVFAVYYGGAHGATHALASDPTSVYTLARVVAALLGTLALWLLYLVGARLFSRAVGLLAAAIEAVAFLPVFYAHLALNDVPTLAPLTLSLLGSAGVLRKGRRRDHLLAGLGLGLACASKYTAGIVLLPYLAALVHSWLAKRPGGAEDSERSGGPESSGVAERTEGSSPSGELERSERSQRSQRRERGVPWPLLGGLALALLAALAGFLIANPYALLDFSSFRHELVHQSTLSAESQGKLGAPTEGGFLYYLWVLTWGLGWAPALASLAGALAVWRHERRVAWLLVPAPVLFLIFMGTEGRYFGRWLMPILPLLCLLAAFFVVWLACRLLPLGRDEDGATASQLRSRGFVPSLLLGSLLVAGVLVQGLVYSIHSGTVLARADTRGLTRDWMLTHIPRGAKVVVEPVSPNDWAAEDPGAPACPKLRWCKYPSLFYRVGAKGQLLSEFGAEAGVENYVRTLAPSLLRYYVDHDYCWVVTGSVQRDRAFAAPKAVPRAVAYYRRLARHGTIVYRVTPYGKGQRRVPFNFDWSFDYYPLNYHLPGPVMTVYRLHGGRCGI
jgi:Dolichyl-phosphate-mannose-protein mannosyltransferase